MGAVWARYLAGTKWFWRCFSAGRQSYSNWMDTLSTMQCYTSKDTGKPMYNIRVTKIWKRERDELHSWFLKSWILLSTWFIWYFQERCWSNKTPRSFVTSPCCTVIISSEIGQKSVTLWALSMRTSTKGTVKNLITLFYFPLLHPSHSSKSSFKNFKMKFNMSFTSWMMLLVVS